LGKSDQREGLTRRELKNLHGKGGVSGGGTDCAKTASSQVRDNRGSKAIIIVTIHAQSPLEQSGKNQKERKGGKSFTDKTA